MFGLGKAKKLEKENKRLRKQNEQYEERFVEMTEELQEYKYMGTPEEINKKMCILDNQVSVYEKDLEYYHSVLSFPKGQDILNSSQLSLLDCYSENTNIPMSNTKNKLDLSDK